MFLSFLPSFPHYMAADQLKCIDAMAEYCSRQHSLQNTQPQSNVVCYRHAFVLFAVSRWRLSSLAMDLFSKVEWRRPYWTKNIVIMMFLILILVDLFNTCAATSLSGNFFSGFTKKTLLAKSYSHASLL